VEPPLLVATALAALGSAAMAGGFFVFSSFVMSGLARLPPSQGIEAMQSINVTAVRPAFMGALFGTALLSAGLLVTAVVTWGQRPAAYLLAGGLLYLLGTIALTIVCHVPRNDRLMALVADSPEAEVYWAQYLRGWTAWNHVRAAAALAAAASFVVAMTFG